jgi:hypothetical protein
VRVSVCVPVCLSFCLSVCVHTYKWSMRSRMYTLTYTSKRWLGWVVEDDQHVYVEEVVVVGGGEDQ